MEVVYLAWNRLEFTRKTFTTMLVNTNWNHVDRLVIYDDGSTDGTLEYLFHEAGLLHGRIQITVVRTNRLGPVAILTHYIRNSGAELFARIDNDTMLPPRWLDECLELLQQNPNVDLLGIEARSEAAPSGPPPRGVVDTSYIGGIGLMKRRAFADMMGIYPRVEVDGRSSRFGFEEWQGIHNDIRKVWIQPPLPVALLNRVPFEPWMGLSKLYVAAGWQRAWPGYYEPHRNDLWDWWQ